MHRRLLILCVCLALGAALSLASAWGAILWRTFIGKPYLAADEGRPDWGTWPLPPPEGWPQPDSLVVTRSWGYERTVAHGAALETPTGPLNLAAALQKWREDTKRYARERTDLMHELVTATTDDERLAAKLKLITFDQRRTPRSPAGQMQTLMMFRRLSGWPILCMVSSWPERTHPGILATPVDPLGNGWTTQMYLDRGIPWPRSVGAGHFTLPLRPVAWPFALNSAVWALPACLVLCVVSVARRRLRRAGGLCPACRYPIGVASVCTECGHQLMAREIASCARGEDN